MEHPRHDLSCSYTCIPPQRVSGFAIFLSEYKWLLIVLAITLFTYFALEYPQWKAERVRQRTLKQENADKPDSSISSIDASTTQAPSSQSPPDNQISASWIPYLPFAVVLVSIKAFWEGLRQLVLRSLLVTEESGPFLISNTMKAAKWAVTEGPGYVRIKFLEPVHTLTILLWNSAVITIEETVVPVFTRFFILGYTTVKDPALKVFAWMQSAARIIVKVAVWFVAEILYNIAKALWKRLSVLGITLAHAVEITAHELAKDCRALVHYATKAATWSWEHLLPLSPKLHVLGAELYTLGEKAAKDAIEFLLPWCAQRIHTWIELTDKGLKKFLPWIAPKILKLVEATVENLVEFLPWFAQKTFTGVLQPVGEALVEVVRIIQSNPTLAAGVEELSLKVKKSCHSSLERLESVNWLILLETVMTDAFNATCRFTTSLKKVAITSYHYAQDPTEAIIIVRRHTTMVLQSTQKSIKVFMMDTVPNSYHDLVLAVEIVTPIVARAIEILVWFVCLLWQLVSWMSMTLLVKGQLALAWAHLHIGVPAKNFWDTKVLPGLRVAYAKVLEKYPVVAAAVRESQVRLTEVLRVVLAAVILTVIRIIDLLGKLIERIQEQLRSMEPQFEVAKAQIGMAADQIFLFLNDRIAAWTKDQKSD
ncbi:hypothetical protein BGZ65_008215 [Modicella reniformis]|uniref:Uncharacterized protein n=1 Tax=Modicella reniformis TaxID=1440133 RepID=A0A9P6LRV5_9FUNG|nr:hypothetical protein BGZ65_008215 [Modicella reniformis]